MSERIAVIGGAGNMGKVDVEVAQKHGHEVAVVDPRHENSMTPEEAIWWASVLRFSLFPKDFVPFYKKYGHLIRPGQVVIENATVKKEMTGPLKELDLRGTSTISTHRLAKHDQPLRGTKELVMGVGQNSQKAREFVHRENEAEGLIVIYYPLLKHDSMMVKEQLLPHFVMRAVNLTLAEAGVNLPEMWQLAPANAEIFILSSARTLIQDPKISATIIHNFLKDEQGRAMIDTFRKSISRILRASGSEEKLIKLFRKNMEALSFDGFQSDMNDTTTIIIERLANLRLQSVTVLSPKDEPGILAQIATVFAQDGINLTAEDSHTKGETVKFMLGIDNTSDVNRLGNTYDRLTKLGFQVIEHSKAETVSFE